MEIDMSADIVLQDPDLISEIRHGIRVSNLAYQVAKEMGLDDDICYQLAIAGMLHDIGKLRLNDYINGEVEDSLEIEELKYRRMHSKLGYDALKNQGYQKIVLDSILYHHENYDGTGYPESLSGDAIPLGARILRVCDHYAALTYSREYRDAYEPAVALEFLIDEINHFDMEVFLAFQRVFHKLEEE